MDSAYYERLLKSLQGLPCEFCGENATLKCSACKHTRYCSEECQKLDWKQHKKGCKMQQILNKAEEEMKSRPRPRPNPNICTGCGVEFDEDYGCDDLCPTCGYAACESCVCHHSNGTCYCAESNFGRNYCRMEPRWYHTDGNGRPYEGDRHPENYDDCYTEDMFEPEPRACHNCGEVKKVFKEEWRSFARFQ
ncbi:uncharacterized protein BXZ73DRAFT_89879 [Epithele typhae]|uniref:uncharacterized protein n=1 Tax=Epithele typhae TaxID=378194 RepID=UPI002008B9D2|nr:uncharacterized protein BXZ73DRAFT_89879 [Epithele typhae]KAH9932707.1 hypothetical protein BXZ73DRAFT_89879 [Epithele typhae]